MSTLLFEGSCTDRVGRKGALLLPPIGQILRCLVFILQQPTGFPLEFILVGGLLEGLTGAKVAMVSTCYAYLVDLVGSGRRSFRIVIADMVFGVTTAVLQLAQGYLIQLLGLTYPYVLIIVLHSVNLLYVVFGVPHSKPMGTSDKKISLSIITEPVKVSMLRMSETGLRTCTCRAEATEGHFTLGGGIITIDQMYYPNEGEPFRRGSRGIPPRTPLSSAVARYR